MSRGISREEVSSYGGVALEPARGEQQGLRGVGPWRTGALLSSSPPLS